METSRLLFLLLATCSTVWATVYNVDCLIDLYHELDGSGDDQEDMAYKDYLLICEIVLGTSRCKPENGHNYHLCLQSLEEYFRVLDYEPEIYISPASKDDVFPISQIEKVSSAPKDVESEQTTHGELEDAFPESSHKTTLAYITNYVVKDQGKGKNGCTDCTDYLPYIVGISFGMVAACTTLIVFVFLIKSAKLKAEKVKKEKEGYGKINAV